MNALNRLTRGMVTISALLIAQSALAQSVGTLTYKSSRLVGLDFYNLSSGQGINKVNISPSGNVMVGTTASIAGAPENLPVVGVNNFATTLAPIFGERTVHTLGSINDWGLAVGSAIGLNGREAAVAFYPNQNNNQLFQLPAPSGQEDGFQLVSYRAKKAINNGKIFGSATYESELTGNIVKRVVIWDGFWSPAELFPRGLNIGPADSSYDYVDVSNDGSSLLYTSKSAVTPEYARIHRTNYDLPVQGTTNIEITSATAVSNDGSVYGRAIDQRTGQEVNYKWRNGNFVRVYLLQGVITPEIRAVNGRGDALGNESIVKDGTNRFVAPYYALQQFLPPNYYMEYRMDSISERRNGRIAVGGKVKAFPSITGAGPVFEFYFKGTYNVD